MKVARRLKRQVQRLERERLTLLRELSARPHFVTEAEADAAANRARNAAFWQADREQQRQEQEGAR